MNPTLPTLRVGGAQVDITPTPGIELCGFAARTQPSSGLLDPLRARCLYLEQGSERLLWAHADLIGFDRNLVVAFRQMAHQRFDLAPDRVLLSATHTHAGPATLHLQEAGAYEPAYAQFLLRRLEVAASAALARTEACSIVVAEGQCDLAVDRRGGAAAQTDPRVGAIGFRRADGTFAAALINHAMHAVALGPGNRLISADVPGRTAAALAHRLPGGPLVLATNGACGNLNPPALNVPSAQIEAWGQLIADAVAGPLAAARPDPTARLHVCARVVPVPVEVLTPAQIDAYAARVLGVSDAMAAWGQTFHRAVAGWQQRMRGVVRQGAAEHREAELFGVLLGTVALVGINAEAFSAFTTQLRARTDGAVYVIGYANGVLGYLPTRAAYAEGGYEVELAHLFYGDFRPRPGALELLAGQAAELVTALRA